MRDELTKIKQKQDKLLKLQNSIGEDVNRIQERLAQLESETIVDDSNVAESNADVSNTTEDSNKKSPGEKLLPEQKSAACCLTIDQPPKVIIQGQEFRITLRLILHNIAESDTPTHYQIIVYARKFGSHTNTPIAQQSRDFRREFFQADSPPVELRAKIDRVGSYKLEATATFKLKDGKPASYNALAETDFVKVS
jgi:hypothetical protein